VEFILSFFLHGRTLKKIGLLQNRGRNGEDFLLPASPRPASPRKKLSPPRPAPLFQGISINDIDTKGRNGEGFLLPASPRPVSIFYFSSPPRPAPIPRPVSVSVTELMFRGKTFKVFYGSTKHTMVS
jgi:hypothetical protein